MKQSMNLAAAVAIAMIGTPLTAQPDVPPPGAAPNLSETQKAVWQGEVDYWKHVNARDSAAYLKLWHPDFTGWPCGAGQPADLSGLAKMADQWFADRGKAGQHTTPKVEAVVVDEGFAITYLSARTTWADAEGKEQSKLEKFVHTWKATDDGWRIIGGMCAPLESYPTALEK